jgi:hypothetical protein
MIEIVMESQISGWCQRDVPGAKIAGDPLVGTAAMPNFGRLFRAGLRGFRRVYLSRLSLFEPTESRDADCQVIEASMDVGFAAAVKALHDQPAAGGVLQAERGWRGPMMDRARAMIPASGIRS